MDKENKKKIARRIVISIVLIPITAAAFACLPTLIADKVSYVQSKKYGR